MALISKQIEQSNPKQNKGIGASVRTYNDQFNGGQIRTMFLSMLGAVGFVLLIVCANVTNLLMARTMARSKEMSIRAAMGASRWNVIRQILIESVMLGLAGGALGILITYIGVGLFDKATADVGKPFWIDFRIDWIVYTYLAAICVGSGVIFGLAPALRISKLDVNKLLKEGERGGSGGRAMKYFTGAMVAGQLAAALMLLVGAGLMMRSLQKVYELTAGISGERIAVLNLSLSSTKYPKAEDRQQFVDQLIPRLQAVPGVAAAGLTTNLPYLGADGSRFEMEGSSPVDEDKLPSTDTISVAGNYFGVIDRGPMKGRAIDDQDGLRGRQNVAINSQFAKKFWPNQDAIGKRIKLRKGVKDIEEPWLTVVGIMPDVKQNQIEDIEMGPVVYIPARQYPMTDFWIMARTSNEGAKILPTLRKLVQDADPNMPASNPGTLLEQYNRRTWAFRIFGAVFSTFGVFAFILAGLGLYAVVSYSVSQRTREIGIRMALGASSNSVLSSVLLRGATQLFIGIALGLVGAFAVTRFATSVLAQISPTDPLTFATVSILLSAVGLLAAWIPARRAAKVDPMVALRFE